MIYIITLAKIMFKIQFENFVPNVSINRNEKTIIVYSNFIVYGDFADENISKMIEDNINFHWNINPWRVKFENENYELKFLATAKYTPDIHPQEIARNQDLRNVYIRVEDISKLHVSYADGRGSNSGYFLISNLIQNESTTIAHEYGHMLGLWPDTIDAHPENKDYRGKGMPGIMYPRGTLVDPQYQYDSEAVAGEKGGTVDPKYRRVNENDISVLMTLLKDIKEDSAVFGKLSNIYHEKD